MTFILDMLAWEAYKFTLDDAGGSTFQHSGSPPEYPCFVASRMSQDSSYFDHEFLLRAELEAMLSLFHTAPAAQPKV